MPATGVGSDSDAGESDYLEDCTQALHQELEALRAALGDKYQKEERAGSQSGTDGEQPSGPQHMQAAAVDTAAAAAAAGGEGLQPLPSWVPTAAGGWRKRLAVMQQALQANRELQQRLRGMLAGVDQALDANWGMQLRVKGAEAARRMGPAAAAAARQPLSAAAAAAAGRQQQQRAGGSYAGDVAVDEDGAMLPFRRTMPHTYDPGPSTAITLPGPATLGPNRPLLRSRFWSLPGGGGCAPLPPGGRRLLAADRGQLVGRLWACRLGKWTPGEEAALREAVRLAAIKVLYTHELQVGSGAL
ncbi:hypothetical protein OEZ85_005569 [Tetradesmus obliquus]|uniref:Uncharacterized protein n=1 Tax=Tetradesmus obliquus TaxID=3088 RepID=A0ABY8UED4_TETOB|nr:hypothetical protein OEZ85_005569 [Tetradesmus obliquus]